MRSFSAEGASASITANMPIAITVPQVSVPLAP